MELFEAEVWLGRMARLRNFETKNSLRGFRAVLFRMVPKRLSRTMAHGPCFRAVLFRMVPKPALDAIKGITGFRAVLFRMVPKRHPVRYSPTLCFRAVLFRMVPKHQ